MSLSLLLEAAVTPMDYLVEAARLAAKKKPRLAPFRIADGKSNGNKKKRQKKRLTRLAMDSGAMASLQRFRCHVGKEEDPDLVQRVYESLRGAEETRVRNARAQELINEQAVQQAQTREAEIEAARQRHAAWWQYECYRYAHQQERERQEAMLMRQQGIEWQAAAQAQVQEEVAMAIEAKGGNGKAVHGRCNHCFEWVDLVSDGMMRRHGDGAPCAGSHSLYYARAN